jgi:hypothetical protein
MDIDQLVGELPGRLRAPELRPFFHPIRIRALG